MGMLARAAVKAFDQGVGTIAAGQHIYQSGFGRSNSGIGVSTDKALGYSPFWAGVQVIAGTYAQVPLNVMRRIPGGGKEKAVDHWLYPVLHDQPNPRMTSFQWRETSMTHTLTWGTPYSVIARDGRGRVRELWPLSPDRMTVKADEAGNIALSYLRLNGTSVPLDPRDVLRVPGLAWDGIVGLSPIKYHREAIGLGLATEEHGARFFGQGAQVEFVLTTPNKLSDKALGHLKEQLETEHSGLANSHRGWILEEDLKPSAISMPNDDAQWLETRKHQVHEIARVLNIHPYKLGVAEPGAISYKSVEQFATDFVTNTMLPWYVRGEQAFSQQLLGDDWTGNGGDYYVQFDVRGLTRGDMAERFAAYGLAIDKGFMTPNEPRELEDWNLLPGLDLPRIPLNMTTVQPDGTSTRIEFAPATPSLGGSEE